MTSTQRPHPVSTHAEPSLRTEAATDHAAEAMADPETSSAAPSLETGRVERIEGPVVVVWAGDRTVRAKRAPACIVAPELRDRVLLAHADGRTYVLAVLEREEEQAPIRLAADGDLRVESTAGRVDVVAAQGASVATRGTLSLRARALEAKSELAELAFAKLGIIGSEVLAEVSRSKLVGRAIESVAEVVQQTASRVSRVVTEMEHVRVGTLDLAADKSAMIHAENAVVTAKALVKVDGELVQLG